MPRCYLGSKSRDLEIGKDLFRGRFCEERISYALWYTKTEEEVAHTIDTGVIRLNVS